MFRSPDWYGYLTATFVPVRRFDISLSGTYTGEMLVQHAAGSGTPVDTAVTTPDFFALNVKLTYEFPILRTLTLQLHAGVQNLFDAYQSDFDQGWERDSGYVYGPSLPRSWFVGAKIRLLIRNGESHRDSPFAFPPLHQSASAHRRPPQSGRAVDIRPAGIGAAEALRKADARAGASNVTKRSHEHSSPATAIAFL